MNTASLYCHMRPLLRHVEKQATTMRQSYQGPARTNLLLLCRCCALNRAPAAVDAALVAICHLSASSHLQHMLLEVGALPYLVPLLLEYDVTLSPETSVGLQLPFTATGAAVAADDDRLFEASFRMLDSALVRPNMQEARSQHALLAAQALGRLAGGLLYVCCFGNVMWPLCCEQHLPSA